MYIIILALFLNLIACNSRYLLVVYIHRKFTLVPSRPALAGIYGWYKPHRLHNPLHLPPATAGIYRLYIPLIRIEKIKDMPALAGIYWWYILICQNGYQIGQPALAGIYWWYISSHTNHLYIICTKIKIFLAFLQENLQLCHFFL